MKLTKLFAAIALLGLLTTSCSSDDNSPIEVVKPTDSQKEIGKEMPFTGHYVYTHAGNPIPFTFDSKVITLRMSEMGGSGAQDDVYDVLTVYENKEGVKKVVAKNKDAKEYKAFFFKSITEPSVDINIDYTFETEIQAINVNYPSNAFIAPDHTKNQFGWLKLTNADTAPQEINLPVNGKYVFSKLGHTYSYNITNDVVNFNGTYDMKVLKHNTKTNKILLQGQGEAVANQYYVMQLKNITDTTVDIARATYGDADAKTQAEAEFAIATELDKGFTTYTKETDNSAQAFPMLKGTYETVKLANGAAQYRFKLGNNDEAFLFMMDQDGTMVESATLKLKREFADEKSGQLIYKIVSSTGYYSGRDNQFLTVYAKDISKDGSAATFAIATKDGSGSIAASKGDIIGKTLEEAKQIAAPGNDKLWGEDMMVYAHVWIKTTRK